MILKSRRLRVLLLTVAFGVAAIVAGSLIASLGRDDDPPVSERTQYDAQMYCALRGAGSEYSDEFRNCVADRIDELLGR